MSDQCPAQTEGLSVDLACDWPDGHAGMLHWDAAEHLRWEQPPEDPPVPPYRADWTSAFRQAVSDLHMAGVAAVGNATDCPFCARIKAGEYDYRDEHAVAFEPLHPVTPGHFLAVPRSHAASAIGRPTAAGHAMHLAAVLAAQMELEACNFIISAGPAATQTVMHLHVHVVPRRPGDGLALPWTGQPRGET